MRWSSLGLGISLTGLVPRELLDGLNKVGFKTNMGIDGSGFLILAMLRLGGYYLGACATHPDPFPC